MKNYRMGDISTPVYDIRQSEKFAGYIRSQGWIAEKIGETWVYIKTWPILGAVAKILRHDGEINWQKLSQLQKQYRIFTTRIEPRNMSEVQKNEYKKYGYKFDTNPLRPTKTLRIDLTGSENDLLSRFDRARSWIKKVGESGYDKKINKFDEFFNIWQSATELQKIWISTKMDFDNLVKIFAEDCFCVTLNQNCGCLVLIYKQTAYYYYAAALPTAKEQELPYAVVWEAMKIARERGCEIWDFESLFDSRWPKLYTRWKGFSQFKKTFGGMEVEYPGCFTKNEFKKIFGL